tara:strand:+ start:3301 stop:3597 length:297 start_codon:yes stop_codon:yes gene_type:complete
MQIDIKKFKSLQRKVLKKYPNATTRMNSTGEYYITNGEGGVIGTDILLPSHKSVQMAWYWAAECIRFTQNINRTHPMRAELSYDEKKFNRVSRRNRKK